MTDSLIAIFNVATAVALVVIVLQLGLIISLLALDVWMKLHGQVPDHPYH